MDLITKIEGNIAWIILNRPSKYNSINHDLALSIQKALDEYHYDKNVRCIVITGEGKAFCAGQDLQEVVDPNGPELRSIVKDHYNPIIRRIRSIEKPIIAAVNGVAAGAGANIALACDVVIATSSAKFIQAFSQIGLIPDSAGTFFLPRLIGFQRASAIAMLGDKITAQEAESMGMIYKAIEDDSYEDFVLKIATKLSLMPTKGLGLTKRAFNESMNNNLDQQLDLEEELQTIAADSYDYKEGVNAFLEKRKPVFKGE